MERLVLVLLGLFTLALAWMNRDLQGHVTALEADNARMRVAVAEAEEAAELALSSPAPGGERWAARGRGAMAEAFAPGKGGWTGGGAGVRGPSTIVVGEGAGAAVAEAPETEAEQEAHREEMREQMREQIIEVVEARAETSRWGEDTTLEVLRLVEESQAIMGVIHDDIRDGALSSYDGHQEMRDAREEMAAQLTEVVGADEAEALQEQMWDVRREVWRGSH